MEEKIISILRGLMAQPSLTNTRAEGTAANWMLEYLETLPYFRKHPDQYGAGPLPEDLLGRKVVWALVRGHSVQGILPRESPTVILLGHYDVVPVSVYGKAEPWAYDLDAIAEKLADMPLSPEAKTDLLSGEWIFGRGSCDMKGGIAVQLAILAERAEKLMAAERAASSGDNGSLLFVSVPDEESFSVGMRGATGLLEELRSMFALDYRLVICSEPNRRLSDGRTQVINSGSVGKLLPVVLVQGKLVQVGNYREGLNPLGVLGRIVASTEGDESFTELCEEERSVPPAWLYARDLKEDYDFSLPRRAAGCCNILTFRKTPAQVLAYFLGKIQGVLAETEQPVSVMTWSALWQRARVQPGFAIFAGELEKEASVWRQELHKTFPEVTLHLIERTLDFLQMEQPMVILGFAPPYYPAVRSEELVEKHRFIQYKEVIRRELPVVFEPYFLGVSDCSYCGLAQDLHSPAYPVNTPLWGRFYSFDIEELERLRIPFFLVGPWGKDLHQRSERVNRDSLVREYPRLLEKLLQCVWLTK